MILIKLQTIITPWAYAQQLKHSHSSWSRIILFKPFCILNLIWQSTQYNHLHLAWTASCEAETKSFKSNLLADSWATQDWNNFTRQTICKYKTKRKMWTQQVGNDFIMVANGLSIFIKSGFVTGGTLFRELWKYSEDCPNARKNLGIHSACCWKV